MGEWGTVCDDGWYSSNTNVICRQLGFGTYGSTYYGSYFDQGSGPIWLDRVTCTGSESTLVNCSHLGFNVTISCSHSDDVGVRCYGTQGMLLFFSSLVIEIIIIIIKPGARGQRPCAWFLEIALVRVTVCMCVSVCLPPRPLITSGVIWCDIDCVQLVKQVLWLFPAFNYFIWHFPSIKWMGVAILTQHVVNAY